MPTFEEVGMFCTAYLTLGHAYLTLGHAYLTLGHVYLTLGHADLTLGHVYLTLDTWVGHNQMTTAIDIEVIMSMVIVIFATNSLIE